MQWHVLLLTVWGSKYTTLYPSLLREIEYISSVVLRASCLLAEYRYSARSDHVLQTRFFLRALLLLDRWMSSLLRVNGVVLALYVHRYSSSLFHNWWISTYTQLACCTSILKGLVDCARCYVGSQSLYEYKENFAVLWCAPCYHSLL